MDNLSNSKTQNSQVVPENHTSIKKIYDDMCSGKYGERVIYYSDFSLPCKCFEQLNYEALRMYFEAGKKTKCLDNSNCNDLVYSFFMDKEPKNETGMMRLKHAFSNYFLGIYLYDHIKSIKSIFEQCIKRTRIIITNDDLDTERDIFLYMWYLTALFHDMGYLYETGACPDDLMFTKLSQMIEEHKIEAVEKTFSEQSAFVLPPIYNKESASDYFLMRKNEQLHGHIDHAVAGGQMLFEGLRQVASELDRSVDMNENDKELYGRQHEVFNFYNKPVIAAIICHNIWLKEKMPPNTKHSFFKSYPLYEKGKSPIIYENNPLLFLLDFIDTLDPFKRFGLSCLNSLLIERNEDNALTVTAVDINGSRCPYATSALYKISIDLDFLKSDSFKVDVDNDQDSITFSFG